MSKIADVEITPAGRRIGRSEIAAKHIGNRHAHFMTGAGIADHRRHKIRWMIIAERFTIEGVNRADRRRLLSRAEPGF